MLSLFGTTLYVTFVILVIEMQFARL